MSSNIVPIYRYGKKYYVTVEEYERIRLHERRNRRTSIQKIQNLPMTHSNQISVRSPSTSLYNPIERNNSNSYDHKFSMAKTSNNRSVHSPTNTNNRSSRSSLKNYPKNDELPLLTKKRPPNSTRSQSLDKILDARKASRSSLLSSHNDTRIQRSSSAEHTKNVSNLQKKASKIASNYLTPPTASDYGLSSTTALSMTTNDRTYTRLNSSQSTKHRTQTKPSNLNSSSKLSSTSKLLAAGSSFETNTHSTDHSYGILSSMSGRLGANSSSIVTHSNSDNYSRNEYYQYDTMSGSLTDESSTSLLALFQQRLPRSRRSQRSNEIDDDPNQQQRDILTRSTIRSQSSDGLLEKKRVRFADTEGLQLEITPNPTQLHSPIQGRFVKRRHNIPHSSNSKERIRPSYHTLSRAITKQSGSKLATDV